MIPFCPMCLNPKKIDTNQTMKYTKKFLILHILLGCRIRSLSSNCSTCLLEPFTAGKHGVMSLNSIPIRGSKADIIYVFPLPNAKGKNPTLLCKSKVMAVLTGACYRKFDYQSGASNHRWALDCGLLYEPAPGINTNLDFLSFGKFYANCKFGKVCKWENWAKTIPNLPFA